MNVYKMKMGLFCPSDSLGCVCVFLEMIIKTNFKHFCPP